MRGSGVCVGVLEGAFKVVDDGQPVRRDAQTFGGPLTGDLSVVPFV
jgi:hypothetical protein